LIGGISELALKFGYMVMAATKASLYSIIIDIDFALFNVSKILGF